MGRKGMGMGAQWADPRQLDFTTLQASVSGILSSSLEEECRKPLG